MAENLNGLPDLQQELETKMGLLKSLPLVEPVGIFPLGIAGQLQEATALFSGQFLGMGHQRSPQPLATLVGTRMHAFNRRTRAALKRKTFFNGQLVGRKNLPIRIHGDVNVHFGRIKNGFKGVFIGGEILPFQSCPRPNGSGIHDRHDLSQVS